MKEIFWKNIRKNGTNITKTYENLSERRNKNIKNENNITKA